MCHVPIQISYPQRLRRKGSGDTLPHTHEGGYHFVLPGLEDADAQIKTTDTWLEQSSYSYIYIYIYIRKHPDGPRQTKAG